LKRSFLGAIEATSITLTWLSLMPWDMSEVDRFSNRIDGGGGDDAFGSWRSVAMAVLTFAVVLVVVRYGLGRFVAVAVAVTVGSFWFLYRTGVARTSGVNLFIAAWLIFFLPCLLVVSATAAIIGRRLATRLNR
jgi:uncharacterized membrane protein YjjP (DUF1212 family)